MSDQHQPTLAEDPIREELVAYLDGELDADARVRVENRLATDGAYRQELNQLEKAWELLGDLPQTQVDADFAQSTVEMVAVVAAEEALTVKSGRQRQRVWQIGGGIAAIFLAALVGFFAVGNLASAENDALVRDLPVIENVELYRHVDSVEFLRQLDETGLFDDEEVSDAS